MINNEFIPASLRIGKMRSILDSSPIPKPSTDDLVRMVNNRYADYLKNQVDWEHNDTRDLILKMKIAIEQLAAERDEARRDVCSMMHMTGFLGGDYAHSKGWDCFKDVHTGFSPEIQNFRDIFYRHKDELRSDRDEARREVCKLKSLNFEGKITPEDYALLRKWDCFKTVSTEKS